MSNKTIKSALTLAISAIAGLPLAASACGAEPFLGEICTVPYTFCPRGFVEAEGQLLSINQNTALFSLIGTTYGGDGSITFALPDLRGRAPIGVGQGGGLTNVDLGEEGGAETVTLTQQQMPAHTHAANTNLNISTSINAVSGGGNTTAPAGKVLAASVSRDNIYSNATPNTTLASGAISTTASASTTLGITGSSQPVNKRSPYLGVRYCIALQGIFPSRN